MKRATREAFGKALEQIVKENNDVVVLDADLAPANKTCYAKQARPDQFYSMGIAEANMVGVGAGMSLQGLKPFVSSFAMFLAGRAFEQIRNSVAYPHLNVKLCATHAGITVGEDGATHQCNEDIALMRVLPGMVVLQPCDYYETKAMMDFMVDYVGPVYLRTSRFAVNDILDESYHFHLGDLVPIKKGEKVCFLATGIMVDEAKKAMELLKKDGINPAIYNVPTLKPINKIMLKDIVEQYDYVFTLEEHNVIGGLYSIVSEIIHEKMIYPIAINDTFTESGMPLELMEKYGIDAKSIVKSVKERVKGNVKV